MSDDFTFTDWFYNPVLEEFYSKTKDLFNHDRCTHCECWVLTKMDSIPEIFGAVLVTCPNCGHKEVF